MTRTDWIVSIYAGAVWGGIFWQILYLFTKLGEPVRYHPTRSC